MRQFQNDDGKTWTAAYAQEDGEDYKGRVWLVFKDDADGEFPLTDVRWNSVETAERTLNTMSGVELRRRLRSALGRAGRRANA